MLLLTELSFIVFLVYLEMGEAAKVWMVSPDGSKTEFRSRFFLKLYFLRDKRDGEVKIGPWVDYDSAFEQKNLFKYSSKHYDIVSVELPYKVE